MFSKVVAIARDIKGLAITLFAWAFLIGILLHGFGLFAYNAPFFGGGEYTRWLF